jgi:hypothetical protein
MKRAYNVFHKPSGSFLLLNADELVSFVGVEISYIDWVIMHSGSYESSVYSING